MKLTEIFDVILESTDGKIVGYAFYVGNLFKDEAKDLKNYKGINVYTHLHMKESDVILYMEDELLDEDIILN
jgi:hypothetical protein